MWPKMCPRTGSNELTIDVRCRGDTVLRMTNLDRPRESTVRQLYALSMNRCAYPNCPTQLVTSETGTIVGEVCHIRAHKPGGPRYMREQTDEERHGFDNLILMCGNHHKEIDTAGNIEIYTVEWLFERKRAHENDAREHGPITAPHEVIKALTWTAVIYEAGSTHMDFRNAVFKVGGEGGGPLGGGGSGGVVTIVGIASLPKDVADEMTIDLAGGNGQFPGGGGGGGGLLVFEGRTATKDDIANGLKVVLFFPADSSRVADALLYVLAGGWEHFWVKEFPCNAHFNVAFMIEFGHIDENVLLGFEFIMTDPRGNRVSVGTANVEVPKPAGNINRRNQVALISYAFDGPGIYELSMQSGGIGFARYSFEVRPR
jgi:hypothetical protein